jgi:hypothetical protein
MEPTVDIYLGPQPSAQKRLERVLTVGVMVFVLVVLGTMISALLVN